jgi:glutamine synthetase
VPAANGVASRVEYRSPDPATNPYLCFAVLVGAGLAGIEGDYELPGATNDNVYELSQQQRDEAKIDSLPGDLGEALRRMERSDLVADVLGEHLFRFFLANKRSEWSAYNDHVTNFELDRYLPLL